jgi:inner membrane protein involved in colicin E2 resistance
MPCTIHYEFTQKFNVTARKAFAWCVDYRSNDMALMQEENATRSVQRIADYIVILTDTFVVEGKNVEKQKLVCVYPERLMWTSTHLTGPYRHSQFLYEITAQTAEKSQLKFTALSLDYQIENEEEAKERGEDLRKMDSETWKLLAREMEKELGKRQ